MADEKVKGQSANPRGASNLRSIQIVLNNKYVDEMQAVAVLDKARLTRDEKGDLHRDRFIITQALIALGEKYPSLEMPDRVTPEQVFSEQVVGGVTQAIIEMIESIVSGAGVNTAQYEQSGQRAAIRQRVMQTVTSVIATDNMVGDSYKWQEDDDE